MKRLALILLVAGAIALAGGTALAQRASGQTVSGTAENLTSGSLVIQGKTIVIDENTIVEGTLTPGAAVVIKTDQIDGALHAARIIIRDTKADSQRKSVEIDGTISAITADSITVGARNKTILIGGSTKVEGELAVGVEVEVKAQIQADGSLLAVKIEVEEYDGDDDRHQEDDDDGDDRDDDAEGRFTPVSNAVPAGASVSGFLSGQQVFKANCTGCHGVPSTNRTQSRLVSFISGHNTGRNLTAEQVAAIAAWLKP